MMLVIRTQYCENYGAHDWDGEGECPQYWKFKGGSEYFIEGVDPLKVAPGLLVEQVRGQVEYSNPMAEEYIVDWELVADDYMTDFERSQLEYEGRITFPARILEVDRASV